MLVQPFVEGIRGGEFSLVFFDGVYSHAALKQAAPGDWRTAARLGGSNALVKPPASIAAFAHAVMEAVPDTLYARVDVVAEAGRPMLMELELVEPHLFLDLAPWAATTFAKAIAGRLARP
jgi:glutathione synthase/RimK-type ligase-like ATP-grasp enzyme